MWISQSKQQIRCCIRPDALGLPMLVMLNYGITYLLRAEWLSPMIQNQFRHFVFCFLDNLTAVLWQFIVLNKDFLLILRFTDVFHRHFIRHWLCFKIQLPSTTCLCILGATRVFDFHKCCLDSQYTRYWNTSSVSNGAASTGGTQLLKGHTLAFTITKCSLI